jgi:hypothetical protein
MDLTIHTYGHIDAMYYTLNAIAMLMNDTLGKVLMTTAAMGSVAYYAFKMSYSGSEGYKIHMSKVVGMVAMMHFLLLPRTDMMIYDHVSKKSERVDNLPLGFALPVGILENFGDLLTTGFEQAFTLPNSTSYRDYGMVFGARLVQDSRNWRIRSPEFLENMSSFVDRCVMIDAMIGYYYAPEDLLKTNDIWQLVSENAGTLRQVAMRKGRKGKEMMSCKVAAEEVIKPAFKLEIEDLERRNTKMDFGAAGALNYVHRILDRVGSNFKKNIEMSFKNYLGVNSGAENLIRQQMMINSLKNYSDEYGYARASATQESNWMIAGDLAGTYLPILMSVLKCLVYSSFIFLFPLLLLSGGWTRYLGYLSLAASFQLWAPLNAVLNMFIDIYSSSTLSGIAGNIVSFSSVSRIGNYTDKIVAVASGLQIAIPFLSFSIIQGGVGGFIHLAGTITGASQSAASQAANESVTGNKSFDNYSAGNQQLYNQSGFKTDWNQSYAAGAGSYQHMDGTMEKVTGSGNTLMQSGIGITASGGSTSYKLDDSRQGQVTQGTQLQEALHQQDMRSSSNAKHTTFARAADHVAQIAQREHAGETFNYESMGEQGKALQLAVNHTKQLHDKKGYGWGQAAQAGIEGSITGGTPFKGITGSGVSASVKGSVNATNSSDQSVGIDTIINRDKHANESYNNILKAASNESWAKENNLDTSYSNAVKGSYEEQQRLERQASVSQQRVEDWHRVQSVINSQSAGSSKDMYQEVVDGLKHEGVDAKTAHNMADKRSPEAQRVWQNIQKEDHYVHDLANNISNSRQQVSGANAANNLDQFSNEHSSRMTQNPEERVRQYARDQGQNIEELKGGVEKAIQISRNNTENQHKTMIGKNGQEHATIKKYNEYEEEILSADVKKYERNRIGRLGGIANVVGNPNNAEVREISKEEKDK